MTTGTQRKFSVRWFDELSGQGMLRDTETMISYPFYSCNVKGANSLYPQLVDNVTLEKCLTVFGIISDDNYLLRNCGVTEIQIPTKDLILKHQHQPDYRDNLEQA